jgi:hypothetical protein
MVKRHREWHGRVVEGLNQKDAELEKSALSIQKMIQKIENHYKQQNGATEREGELRKTNLASAEACKVQTWRSKLQESKKLVHLRENELVQVRYENESMKRETARLQHEIKFHRIQVKGGEKAEHNLGKSLEQQRSSLARL